MYTVLITGCSMHSNDLITELRNNYDREKIRVIGINCDKTVLLRNNVDRGYVVPRITSPIYIKTLIEICECEKVDVILPFITAELPILAAHKDEIESHGTKVSVSSLESLEAVGNKIALAEKYGDLMPMQTVVHSVAEADAFAHRIGYPAKKICCKIDGRCGGVGFAVVDDEKGYDITLFNKFGKNRYIPYDMLAEIVRSTSEDIILQEFEEGNDYSLCCLANNGRLLYSLGFEASLMSYGSAMYAEIKQNDEAEAVARRIIRDTKLDGNLCIDFIVRSDGSVKMLEVNPRISATLPFIARAGLNLPYLRCLQLLGKNIENRDFEINYNLKMQKNYASKYFE